MIYLSSHKKPFGNYAAGTWKITQVNSGFHDSFTWNSVWRIILQVPHRNSTYYKIAENSSDFF